MSNILHSKESVNHYTPAGIIERARDVLGRIALDPASDAFANETVQATTFYAREGLFRNWYGPLFLNPPGKSDDNPGGASAWWHKLIAEWEMARAANHAWSAIFVGFSLEILQTCQSKSYRHPLSFPTCVPKRRLRFEVNATELYTDLKRQVEVAELAALPDSVARLTAKLAKVESALKRGERRFPGNSPTHGNFITCVTDDGFVADRFRRTFKDIGVIT